MIGYREELIRNLSENRNRHQQRKYKINIFYRGSDKQYADNIRQTLVNMDNIASIHEFKKPDVLDIADYSIFLGNLNERNLNGTDPIYSAYGINIYEVNTSLIIINDPKVDLKDKRNEFITYYDATIGIFAKYYAVNRNVSTKAKAALKNKMKHSDEKMKTLNLMDHVADFWNKAMNKFDNVPDWIFPLKLGGYIGTFTGEMVCLFSTLPVGITEAVYTSLRDELEDKRFSKTYVDEAQKQIAEVMIAKYFEKEQNLAIIS